MLHKFSILLFLLLIVESVFAQSPFPGLRAEEPAREAVFDATWKQDFHTLYGENARWQQFEISQAKMLNAEQGQLMPEWENLGPNTLDTLSGRILCMTFDPNDSNILYAGTGSGGLWKSINSGDSWVPLTDDLPSMRVSAVAVNPLNSNEILIGTGIGQVQNTSLQPGAGVLKSTDGGQTWYMTGFSFPLTAIVSTYELVWDPVMPGKVFLAATNGLFVSTDDGDNWEQLHDQRIYDFALNRMQPDTMFIAIQNLGIKRSYDGGVNWTTLTNGILSGPTVFRTNIAIHESNPEIMFASMVNGNGFGGLGVYKSTDGGDSWSQLPNVPNYLCQPNLPTSCSGWLFSTIGVSPFNPDHLFIGGVQFWTSINGGLTWTWRDYASNGSIGTNEGLVYVDHWDLEFDPNDPSTIYVCCDGGIMKSTDGGAFWVRKSNDMINAQVYSVASHPTDPDFLIGGFHDHGLQRIFKNDENKTWTRWSLNDGINTVINQEIPTTLIGNIQFGVPQRSTNMGASHQTTFQASFGITEPGPWITPLVAHPEEPSTLYTVSNTRIYKTTNNAVIWQVSDDIANVRTLEINPTRPDTVYAHAYTGNGWTFYRTYDAGENWEAVNTPTIPSWGVTGLASDPNNPNRVYAVRNSTFANNDHIKVSEDNGTTWTDITNDFPDIKVNDVAVSPINEDHIYLATDLGVYLSTNRGHNWCAFNNNLPRIYVMDVDFYPLDSTIRIATFGRGVWQTKAHEALTTSVSTPDITEAMAVEVFPNPVEDYMTINFSLPEGGSVVIDILDIRGQRLNQVFHGTLPEGQQQFSWDGRSSIGSRVAAGVYFVRIAYSGVGVVKRVVVN
ncbi:MAG: FlgD immunoglobulin-like domain containing protein [Bacteroidota bacterium]